MRHVFLWALAIVGIVATASAQSGGPAGVIRDRQANYKQIAAAVRTISQQVRADQPSIEQIRWYLIRPPSFSWTCRKETSWDSVAAYSFTGTLTSPKETAPFQIARMPTILALCVRCSPPPVPTSRAGTTGCTR